MAWGLHGASAFVGTRRMRPSGGPRPEMLPGKVGMGAW